MLAAAMIAFIILFLHACTWEGMIFEDIKKYIKPEGKLYKPIYGCPICMTPWWGTIIYWIFFHVSFINWLLVVGTASGISVVFVVLLALREAAIVTKKLEDESKAIPDNE